MANPELTQKYVGDSEGYGKKKLLGYASLEKGYGNASVPVYEIVVHIDNRTSKCIGDCKEWGCGV